VRPHAIWGPPRVNKGDPSLSSEGRDYPKEEHPPCRRPSPRLGVAGLQAGEVYPPPEKMLKDLLGANGKWK
jgi:hypothetical protein